MKWKLLAIDLICLLLIFVLFYSGLIKILKLPSFSRWIHQAFLFRSLPWFFEYLIPVTEIGIAISFFWRAKRRQSFYSTLGFLTLFILYIILLSTQHENRFFPFKGLFRNISWTWELYYSLLLSWLSLMGIFFSIAIEKSGGSKSVTV